MIIRRFFRPPTSEVRNPFEELERMGREMSRALDDFTKMRQWEPPTGVFPLTNISENKDSFFLRAELPGVKASDVDISMTGDSISISGVRKILSEDEKVKYHRREREAGTFRRMIKLPSLVNIEKVKAKSTDGVLTVVMPKAESTKPRQIAVTSL